MKSLILVAMVAVAAASSPALAQDDNRGITLDENGIHVHRRDNRDERFNEGYHRHHRHDCHTEVTREWRHHHMVTRKVTVCDEGPHRGD